MATEPPALPCPPSTTARLSYFLSGPAASEPVVAIGAGPHIVHFQQVPCQACGGENLIREYAVNILALLGPMAGTTDDRRAQLVGMDEIALAREFALSTMWLTPDEPDLSIAVGTLYSPFPPWVAQANRRLDWQLQQTVDHHEILPPIALFLAATDSADRKCLLPACRHCRAKLPAFDRQKDVRFCVNLVNGAGHAAMEPWLMIAGQLACTSAGS